MNIVYTIGLLAAFISGFFVALICIRTGLKWKIELSQGKEPTLNNPIESVVNAVQTTAQQKAVEKVNKFTSEQLDSINPFL